MASPEVRTHPFADDDPGALAAVVESVRTGLLDERPALGRDGWRRAATEQLLAFADKNGLYGHLKPHFGLRPVDHGLDERRVVQALAVFEIEDAAVTRAALLLAVLHGERSVIEACRDELKLGSLPPKLYEGPFPPMATTVNA